MYLYYTARRALPALVSPAPGSLMHMPAINVPSQHAGRNLDLCSCDPFWSRLLTNSIE